MSRSQAVKKKIVQRLSELPSEPQASARIPDGKLLTTHEVAELLQTDASTCSKWIDKGILRGYRTPGGHHRVLAKDVREMAVRTGMYLPPELA